MTATNAHARAPWRVEAPLAPIEGESLDGLIARVAAANWIENALTITSLAGVVYGHKPTLSTSGWDGLPILADCLQVDLDELQHRSYPTDAEGRRTFYGAPIERNDLDLSVRRFAPAALSISPHHRALWQLRAFPFCAETWQYLVERCPRCGAIQRWHHTNGVARCDRCVEDLSAAQADEVPFALRSTLTKALGLVHYDPSRKQQSVAALPPELQHLPAADVYELLVRVALVVEPRLTPARFGTSARWNQPGPVVADAIASAWNVLLGWPSSLENLMADRLRAAPKRHGDGNNGSTMRFLRLAANDGMSGEVRETIEKFRRAVDLDGPNSALLHERTFSSAEAAARLSRSTRGVGYLRRLGALNTIFVVHAHRAAPRYDAAEINTLANVIAARVPPEHVAWRLGVSYHGVEQLIAMQLLETTGDRFCLHRYGSVQTTRQKFDEFVSRFHQASRSALASDPVTLRVAVSSIGGRLKPWGPIFESLLQGSLPFILNAARPALTEQILVDHSSYRFLRSLRFNPSDYPHARFSSTMSRKDAGEVLNLTPRVYTEVLQAIAPADCEDKSVSVSEVERISRVHISTREMALRLGTTSKAAIARAQCESVPLLGPAGWCRTTCETRLGLT